MENKEGIIGVDHIGWGFPELSIAKSFVDSLMERGVELIREEKGKWFFRMSPRGEIFLEIYVEDEGIVGGHVSFIVDDINKAKMIHAGNLVPVSGTNFLEISKLDLKSKTFLCEISFEEKKSAKRICEPSGSSCNICGGLFSSGEDICSGGKHVIGERY